MTSVAGNQLIGCNITCCSSWHQWGAFSVWPWPAQTPTVWPNRQRQPNHKTPPFSKCLNSNVHSISGTTDAIDHNHQIPPTVLPNQLITVIRYYQLYYKPSDWSHKIPSDVLQTSVIMVILYHRYYKTPVTIVISQHIRWQGPWSPDITSCTTNLWTWKLWKKTHIVKQKNAVNGEYISLSWNITLYSVH